ncbi:hypothetical protein DPMN_176085 [Dreissena polymorpha]|uniref:Uncharacterized protein n=1 Tax=Dreissena polymorpha TaxID=45954 RepID=A0A9D4IJB8_DREPO|nr:hypothetical protein DPMN_176085 [Dreissena polymorpha]
MKGVFFLLVITCIVVEAGKRRKLPPPTTTTRQTTRPNLATTPTPPREGSYEHEQLTENIEKQLKEMNSTLDAIYTLSNEMFKIRNACLDEYKTTG